MARARRRRIEGIAKCALPALVMILAIWLWGRIVVWNEIPHYILPGPGRVWESLVTDWPILVDAALLTGRITLLALLIAVVGGVGLAILFNQSKLVEMSLLSLRGDPAGDTRRRHRAADLHLCRQQGGGHAAVRLDRGVLPGAQLEHTLGLNSVDRNLRDLYSIYGASRWQTLRLLQLPSALPYFLGGLKIAGGLSADRRGRGRVGGGHRRRRVRGWPSASSRRAIG